jgi:hypothetical protein
MFALLIVACIRFASMRHQSTRCVFVKSNEFNCAMILRWCLHIVFVFATLPPPPWLIKMCFMLSVRTQVMTITSTRSSGSHHRSPLVFGQHHDILCRASSISLCALKCFKCNTAIVWYRQLRWNIGCVVGMWSFLFDVLLAAYGSGDPVPPHQFTILHC